MDVRITRKDKDDGGRYEADIEGFGEPAVLTYRKLPDGTIDANHTFVPVPMRGTGIGKALVKQLADDAIEGDYKVIPSCPFVKAHLEGSPEWQSLISERPRLQQ